MFHQFLQVARELEMLIYYEAQLKIEEIVKLKYLLKEKSDRSEIFKVFEKASHYTFIDEKVLVSKITP